VAYVVKLWSYEDLRDDLPPVTHQFETVDKAQFFVRECREMMDIDFGRAEIWVRLD
jgi:hypothetical protein